MPPKFLAETFKLPKDNGLEHTEADPTELEPDPTLYSVVEKVKSDDETEPEETVLAVDVPGIPTAFVLYNARREVLRKAKKLDSTTVLVRTPMAEQPKFPILH